MKRFAERCAVSPIKGLKTAGAAAIAASSEIGGGVAKGDSASTVAGNAVPAAAGAAAGTFAGNSKAGQMLTGKAAEALGDVAKKVSGGSGGNIGFAAGQAAGSDVSKSAASAPVKETVNSIKVGPTRCPTGNPHC